MLALTVYARRNREDEIVIDHPAGPIVVKLIKAAAGKAKLGVSAPKSVKVHRRNVWDLVQAKETA